MTIETQAVHFGVVLEGVDHIQCGAVISGAQHAERITGDRHPLDRQLAIQRLGNVARHTLQAGVRVIL
ncbi:hypothetical protein D3C78_1490370 [compost metagenome]